MDIDWDDFDFDDTPAKEEPDCMPCGDGRFRRPRFWWRDREVWPRVRAGRARCPDCNPSPRQIRRWPKVLRHIEHQMQARHRFHVREVAAGRRADFGDEAPF